MNPPENPHSETFGQKFELVAYVAKETGVAPTPDDEDPDFRVLEVRHEAGGGLASAVLSWAFAKAGSKLQDLQLTSKINRQIEIWAIEEDGETKHPLFWGEITNQQTEIAPGSESVTLTAIVEPCHFGDPIKGMLYWDPTAEESAVVYRDPEFNPVVDLLPTQNRYKPDGEAPETFPIWIEPFSADTDEAKDYFKGQAEKWDLVDCVDTLCHWCNEEEEYLKNPKRVDLDNAFKNAPEVKDITLRRGQYLPALLDSLLPPHGFNWVLRFVAEGGSIAPRLAFFRRGSGDAKTVALQAYGDDFDRAKTQLERLSHTLDIAQLANLVRGEGGLKKRQFTIPLHRTWKVEEDGTEDQQDRLKPVGRKWAANEAGDYLDLRPEIDSVPYFGAEFLPFRRSMEDCLTLMAGERIHPFPEYSEDGGETWKPFEDEWQWRKLENEIGIYLTGQKNENDQGNGIPETLLSTSEDLKMRITCVLTADVRISHEVDNVAESPNSKKVKLQLDLHDQFRDWQLHEEGEFANKLDGEAETHDDQEALETYVEEVAKNEQSAVISASLPLTGICLDYKIGDLITEVKGRNISLNRNSKEAASPRYLQVVGITYTNNPDQRTELTVVPYDIQR